MGEDNTEAKRLLRSRMRAIRRDLPQEAVARLSAEVCACVLGSPAFAQARRLVAYAAADNEVDPAAIVTAAGAAGKRVYYPRAADTDLEFLEAAHAELHPGRRGIREPVGGESLPPAADGVLFLVPGLAFDARGARLGRGAGSYDRALARHVNALRIGLAYEFQLVQRLPEAAWDIRMDAVATDARLVDCAVRRRG